MQRLVFAIVGLGLLASSPVSGAPAEDAARQAFAEAQAICERDDGQLWGASLCGPILIVDPEDRGVVANQADAQGALAAADGVYLGALPDDVVIANTPTEWSGVRWTQLVAPLPTDPMALRVLLAHELFHRIQQSLGLLRPQMAGNDHLDTLEGRFLLQLEWRALARALSEEGARDRRAAIEDALSFRRERYRLFPDAAAEESALELNEGVPEYTGVVLGLSRPADRTAYALGDLETFVDAPTFVRSFAYATGPAYGLMLDETDPAWRTKLGTEQRLDELLAAALDVDVASDQDLDQRVRIYDEDGTLRAGEEQRDAERRARLAAYRARLVDDPVLLLPLASPNFQFNPQNLTPLEGFGMVFPTLQLTADWGVLAVEHGGALVRRETGRAAVSAVGFDATELTGDGWRLDLEPGWEVVAGERAGDFVVQCTDACGE